MDDVGDIAAFYNQDVVSEHNRLDKHQLEFDLTWRCLKRYLPPAGRILEIGAATGRYTLPLCQAGYSVTAVDLSASLLKECGRRLHSDGLEDRAHIVTADARDLSAVPGHDFDAVLLMGPLYHLVDQADREQALGEAVARLRDGGILCSAHLSRFGVLGDLMAAMPDWIERREEVRALLSLGRRPEELPRGGFRGYFALVSEIQPLHEAHGLETLSLMAAEPAISADDASYNRLVGPQRELWLELLLQVSTEQTTIGSSRHLLYIGRKVGSATEDGRVG